MPQMIQMRALVAFDRNGKHVKAGDLLHVFPIEAASLRYLKRADYAPHAKPPAPTPEPPPAESRPVSDEAQRPPAAAPASERVPVQAQQAEAVETADGSRGRRTRTSSPTRRDISNASEG
jgi:hypothetical protein